MARYKCVPAPKSLTVSSKNDYEIAIRSFANLINREAKDGWEFKSMENIAVTHKAGCLMAFLGQSESTTYFNMLIFERRLDSQNEEVVVQDSKFLEELNKLKDLIASKKINELINQLNKIIQSKEEAEMILDSYFQIYERDLIEDLKNTSNSYDKILNCVQKFIDFNLIEAKYPHEKIE